MALPHGPVHLQGKCGHIWSKTNQELIRENPCEMFLSILIV